MYLHSVLFVRAPSQILKREDSRDLLCQQGQSRIFSVVDYNKKKKIKKIPKLVDHVSCRCLDFLAKIIT